MYRIYPEHGERLPFIRIKKIELTNFKGVEHGVIEFNCAKEQLPIDTSSDILGLYGQNGSGKSSLVEAIYVVKGIMEGRRMGPETARYIDVLAEYASVHIEFDFKYRDGKNATVIYETKLKRSDDNAEAGIENFLRVSQKVNEKTETKQNRLCIYDEVVKTDIYADGNLGRMHSIIDTEDNLLCASSLEEFYFANNDKNIVNELTYLKRKLKEDSFSFIFSHAASETFNQKNTEISCSRYYEILSELYTYAKNYLYVIGSRFDGMVHSKSVIPLHIPFINVPILLQDDSPIPESIYEVVVKTIEKINLVIEKVIPDVRIKISATPTVLENGEKGIYIKLLSVREEREFPLAYESDGIIKVISILADYIFAFNQGSATLVVDEFDSGVFEFLLGELLQIFEEFGKGQFVFTSHNLRPLEVINKKFIRFTTTDKSDRYRKLTNINTTNNLRDVYLKEIQLGAQDIELYKKTKSFKIVKALKEAGKELDSDDE